MEQGVLFIASEDDDNDDNASLPISAAANAEHEKLNVRCNLYLYDKERCNLLDRRVGNIKVR